MFQQKYSLNGWILKKINYLAISFIIISTISNWAFGDDSNLENEEIIFYPFSINSIENEILKQTDSKINSDGVIYYKNDLISNEKSIKCENQNINENELDRFLDKEIYKGNYEFQYKWEKSLLNQKSLPTEQN